MRRIPTGVFVALALALAIGLATAASPFASPNPDGLEKVAEEKAPYGKALDVASMGKKERRNLISQLEREMKEAARNLEFERAAELRDMIIELKAEGA